MHSSEKNDILVFCPSDKLSFDSLAEGAADIMNVLPFLLLLLSSSLVYLVHSAATNGVDNESEMMVFLRSRITKYTMPFDMLNNTVFIFFDLYQAFLLLSPKIHNLKGIIKKTYQEMLVEVEVNLIESH